MKNYFYYKFCKENKTWKCIVISGQGESIWGGVLWTGTWMTRKTYAQIWRFSIQCWVNSWCKNSKVRTYLVCSKVEIMHLHVFMPRRCISTTAHVRITYMDIWILMKEELENGKDRAMCPGCYVIIKAINDKGQLVCGETTSSPS